MLAAIEMRNPTFNLLIKFSKETASQHLDLLFIYDRRWGTPERMDYRQLNMVISFSQHSWTSVLDCQIYPVWQPLKIVLISILQGVFKFGKVFLSCCKIQVLIIELGQYKRVVVDTFAEHRKAVLFRLRFYIFDRVVEHLCRFGVLSVSEASPLWLYVVHIETLYWKAPGSAKTKMEETDKVLLLCNKTD